MKIGLFGGTFNPVHYGHLKCAESVCSEFSLDRIVFIPSKIPVHKEMDIHVSGDERAEMIRLAIQGNDKFELSAIELDRDEASYSIFTVREFLKLYPDSELYFILGFDSFNSIMSWREAKELVTLISFIVMQRQGDVIDREVEEFVPRFKVAANPFLDISSSEIRRRLGCGEDASTLMPEAVYKYINERRLYSSE